MAVTANLRQISGHPAAVGVPIDGDIGSVDRDFDIGHSFDCSVDLDSEGCEDTWIRLENDNEKKN